MREQANRVLGARPEVQISFASADESGANSRRVQTLIVILGSTDHPATQSRARKDVARQDRRSNFLAGSTITHSPLSSPKSAWRYCRSCRRSPFVNTGETRRSHANAAFLSVGLLKSNLRSQIVGNRGFTHDPSRIAVDIPQLEWTRADR